MRFWITLWKKLMKNSVVIPSHESCKSVKLEASKIPRSYDYFTVHETRKKKFTIIRALHRTCLQFFFLWKKKSNQSLTFSTLLRAFCKYSHALQGNASQMGIPGYFTLFNYLEGCNFPSYGNFFRQINSKRHCHNDFQFNTLVFKPLEANRSKSAREPRS